MASQSSNELNLRTLSLPSTPDSKSVLRNQASMSLSKIDSLNNNTNNPALKRRSFIQPLISLSTSPTPSNQSLSIFNEQSDSNNLLSSDNSNTTSNAETNNYDDYSYEEMVKLLANKEIRILEHKQRIMQIRDILKKETVDINKEKQEIDKLRAKISTKIEEKVNNGQDDNDEVEITLWDDELFEKGAKTLWNFVNDVKVGLLGIDEDEGSDNDNSDNKNKNNNSQVKPKKITNYYRNIINRDQTRSNSDSGLSQNNFSRYNNMRNVPNNDINRKINRMPIKDRHSIQNNRNKPKEEQVQ